jgi:hypothetical protein
MISASRRALASDACALDARWSSGSMRNASVAIATAFGSGGSAPWLISTARSSSCCALDGKPLGSCALTRPATLRSAYRAFPARSSPWSASASGPCPSPQVLRVGGHLDRPDPCGFRPGLERELHERIAELGRTLSELLLDLASTLPGRFLAHTRLIAQTAVPCLDFAPEGGATLTAICPDPVGAVVDTRLAAS